ncbi:MAG TPA: serine/threonine-protein kinase [Polyangiaceae bacterium]
MNELVAGKYRLSRMIGRGGMGSVWEGVHATLGSRVAIKFIDAEYAESPEALSRFENEAHAAAKLRSKYVVEVYDHGVTADGRPYIVMEFLNGEPLDRRLETHGRLDLVPTAMLMQQVSRALARAHAAGIVHRDLKPENIFLVRDEEDGTEIAKVVDFGIAKFTDRGMGVSSSTRTGSVLGTPFYMSPEQARGLRAVDARSDIWSMGVIAFRCLTGRLPFEGEAVGDLLVKICTGPTPVPTRLVAGLPPEFDSFIARGLAKEPDQRFQSAQELADNLAAIAGLPVQTGPVPYLGDGRAYAGGPTPAGAHTPGGRVWTPGTGPQPPTVAGVAASVERRSSRGGLIAVLVVGFILLAIGVGVAAKLALLDAPPAEASSEAPTAGPPPIPELAAAPATERTTAAPSEPAAVVVAPAAAESSAAASAQPEKATAEPPPKRVAPVARLRPKPEAPKAVVAAPLPARPLPPVSKPPPPKPKTPDVGY